MNDENFKNQNNNFHENTVLEDYEIEVVKKISFWANLIYKFKNIKLLPSGNTKPQKTYKSIFYMWNLGSFKNSIFNTLDTLKASFSKSQNINSKNSIDLQIIGKNNNYQSSKNSNKISIIIPTPITTIQKIKND